MTPYAQHEWHGKKARKQRKKNTRKDPYKKVVCGRCGLRGLMLRDRTIIKYEYPDHWTPQRKAKQMNNKTECTSNNEWICREIIE